MNIGDISKKIIDIILRISDEFYRQHDSKGYTELDKFFEYIDCLLNNTQLLYDELIKNELNDVAINLNRIMEALQEKDSVLIADILRYDIGNSMLNITDYIRDNFVEEREG